MSREADVEAVLQAEGGYVNDPADPGGETIYGISRRAFPAEWAYGAPTLERAKAFYTELWNNTAGALLGYSDGLRSAYFDMAVNAGEKRAAALLVEATSNAAITASFALARIRFYTRLAEKRPSLRAFHFGWVRRALSLS